MKPIEIDELKQLQEEYRKNDKARVVRNALTTTSITSISNVLEAQEANPFFFSVEVPTMKVTNQLQSGRCWIFSSMNVLREIIAKKYKIDQFELSQNYVAFYDKLEKCNWFMNCVLEQIDQPYDDRTLQWLLDNGVGDGGQWDMVVSLVKKYGICPKTAMPETYQSSHTHDMNGLLNKRLRKFASEAKALKPEKREELRTKVLAECYTLIADCFGLPPKSFTFEYVDSKKKYHSVSDVTPKEFYEKYLGEDLDRYAVIINAPTEDKPYHKMYSVKYIGNVVSGNEIRYLNLPMNEFKKAVIAQLKDGKPVWFGCDCGKDGNRQSGLWDDQQFDYEHTFDMDLSMTKEEMLNTRYSAMNHAMVLTGVNLVKGKPTRWKIENSWGDKVAHEGYYIASDSWFEQYVYEAAVDREYLTDAQQKVLKQKVKLLDPWDPFGTLAD
ncbi:C1 family peptidase [Anaerolactibacter massiliensis]|uniref:C1 family peptidase n=1 Tax=Anaerolactibacter massiliensis TaxID=2044573 RepID=UPI000CF8E9A9|nr:C1 family peptidase [Anaerolactibacter massiliensis]